MNQVDTDQTVREASGAHPYGRYLEEFEVGAVYKHWPAKTVTEADDHLFCLITMNHHPLHINDVYAAQSQQGRNVVVGPLVYSLALGMSVSDVSQKTVANHQSVIRQKFGADNGVQLAQMANRLGLHFSDFASPAGSFGALGTS